MKMPLSFFNSNLRYLRKNASISQDALAALLGWRRNLITAYESGISEPNHERLLELAHHFNVTLDDLILKDLSKGPEDSDLKTKISSGEFFQTDYERIQLALDGIAALLELEEEEGGIEDHQKKQLLWLAQKLLSLNAELIRKLKSALSNIPD